MYRDKKCLSLRERWEYKAEKEKNIFTLDLDHTAVVALLIGSWEL